MGNVQTTVGMYIYKQRPIHFLRIRTDSKRGVWANTTCSCGHTTSLHHALSGCPSLDGNMITLRTYIAQHGLKTHELLQAHPQLGTTPMRMLTDALLASEAKVWF